LALIERSTAVFATALAASLPRVAGSSASTAGVVYRFEG
jgi:hypothetical protein